MVLTTVHGKFTDFSGILELEDNDLSKSSVSVRINAASITTENAARDKDLRSANFLDIEKYPEITFVSHRIVKQDDGYLLVGDLNMHGVSKELSIPFTFNGRVKDLAGKMRVGFEGHVTINRKDWGINYGKFADNGGLVAANEVTIELDIEAMNMPAKSGDHIDQK
jgi:polyisoprenoid-binding protein YceI